MHISKIKNSKFLTKEDVTPPKLFTIDRITQQNVAMESQPADLKYVLHFREVDEHGEPTKPLVMNSTNAQLIAQFLGSEETDEWTGKKVVLYNDPSISFGGKLTGGIRVRAPKPGYAGAPATPVPGTPEPPTALAQPPSDASGYSEAGDEPF